MIKTGIYIESERADAWLDAFTSQRLLSGISCTPDILVMKPFVERLIASKTQCVLLQQVTSDDTESLFKLAESADGQKPLHARIHGSMNSAFKYAETCDFTVPFRLDRIPEDKWDSRSAAILEILGTMLSAPMPHDFSLQIPVQLPRPFPQSEELERALELCGRAAGIQRSRWDESFGISEMPPLLSQSSLSLCVHVHPDDSSMLETFEASIPLEFAGSVVFHYDIAAGETLFDDEQSQWADFLKSKSFNGNVVFHPFSCPDKRLAEICEDASAWAVMYS